MRKQTWNQKLNIFMGNIKKGDFLMVHRGVYEGSYGTVVYCAGNVMFQIENDTKPVYLDYADLLER